MNQTQQIAYTQILHYILSLPLQRKFCLDGAFYSAAGIMGLSPIDKRVIGKYFKNQVAANQIANVKFDYIYSNCLRCGYKDSSNKVHYIRV